MNRALLAVLALLVALQLLDPAGGAPQSEGPRPSFLASMPPVMAGRNLQHEARFSEDILGVLAPDDYLIRYYGRENEPNSIEMMIAYFRSQGESFGPHSPKVCLPSAGWVPVSQTVDHVPAGDGATLALNSFQMRNGRRSSVVLYWYQSRTRATPSEVAARLWLAWDTLTAGQRDICLVRVILPFEDGSGPEALRAAKEFASDAHRNLRRNW